MASGFRVESLGFAGVRGPRFSGKPASKVGQQRELEHARIAGRFCILHAGGLGGWGVWGLGFGVRAPRRWHRSGLRVAGFTVEGLGPIAIPKGFRHLL